MSRKLYDELRWWCQLLWPWFGPPWYEQVQDLDAYLAAFRRALTLQEGELAGELAGDDQPGEGYLARAGRLIAARHQAEELIRYQYGSLPPGDEDDGDEDPAPERPLVIGWDHPSWAEVDTGQRERLGDSGSSGIQRCTSTPSNLASCRTCRIMPCCSGPRHCPPGLLAVGCGPQVIILPGAADLAAPDDPGIIARWSARAAGLCWPRTASGQPCRHGRLAC